MASGTVELAEPRDLIAAQCGTAPEVLSRTFRRLEDDGVLAADIDHVTVLRDDRAGAVAEKLGSFLGPRLIHQTAALLDAYSVGLC